jgi:5-methylcytosine-specific restriction protein A
MNRPCLERGCRNVSPKSRCPEHTRAAQRQRDAYRGTPAQRGYDRAYLAARRLILADGPHACAWRCGRVATTADHVIPLAKGGSNDPGNLVPACAPCNSSRGSRTEGWRPPR